MNLELFPDLEPSQLDDLVHEIDVALDACFMSDVELALDRQPPTYEQAAEAPAA